MTHELGMALPLAGGVSVAAAWAGWRLRKLRARGIGRREAPDFRNLAGADGRRYSLASFDAPALVLLFTSNRCPGAKAYDGRMREIAARYAARGLDVVAVNSVSDRLHATETLAAMTQAATERGLPFPYLKDEDQSVARALGVTSTPEVVLFDAARRIRYRGRIDDAFVAARAARHYLRNAIEDVLADREPALRETPALGCSLEIAT